MFSQASVSHSVHRVVGVGIPGPMSVPGLDMCKGWVCAQGEYSPLHLGHGTGGWVPTPPWTNTPPPTIET